ncbi:Eco57I restriction-modification methylase domain-containing protein [Desulfobacca acetoxidans]
MQVTESWHSLADGLVRSTRELMQGARTEEDLRIGFEKCLDPIIRGLGVTSTPRYESLGAASRTIFRGRPDAVHGQVIIEYESPGSLSSERAVVHAEDQLIGYLLAEAQGQAADPWGLLKRLLGIGFDGSSIFLLRYRGEKEDNLAAVRKSDFARHGPYPFNVESARTFLTDLRALARLPLTAENLALRFGPQSRIAPMAVSALVDALENWSDNRVAVFYQEWQRLFGLVYGEQFRVQPEKQARTIAQVYGIGKQPDFQKMLFAIHTYFALLMKFFVAELVTLKDTSLTSSFSHQFVHSSPEECRAQLTDIENGGLYAKRGITNFLEGDFFRWYLDALSPRLEEAIREIARALAEFEPATTAIIPESARDLLKKLYQYLVPQEVRHKLGEYYTPDWLAELVLNEVGYEGDTLKRLLDPACGSGTFLVLAIQRARQYAHKHRQPPLETAKRIAAHIWGFDLNPLAVIATRTNYLFALGDLITELPSLEIPVYLADSVLWPGKTSQNELNFAGGDHVAIQTSVKKFHVPLVWIKTEGFLLQQAAPLLEQMTRQGYTAAEALERLQKAGLVFTPHEPAVEQFYTEIAELEEEGKNGIWARFLKNTFAPSVAGKFDFVVGNPPWIRWGYLSQEYRQATLPLWKEYGLFSLKGQAARLGGGEKDFSMLFTYVATDFYLKKDGTLGFLITQEVFKSKGAGEGFRRFRLGDREPLKVVKAHDFTTVQPFEGAVNKTAAIIIKKSEITEYPIPYTLWLRKQGIGKIKTNLSLKEALPLLRKKNLIAQPIKGLTGPWQTIDKKRQSLVGIRGASRYKARRGASTEPYGVFWLEVRQVLSDGDLIIRNLPEKGRRNILKVEERIEPDLVFPAVRGSDIQRWQAIPGIFLLMPQDPATREPYPVGQMKSRWPRTYGYLVKFRDILLSRGSKTVRSLAERTAFYAMFGIGPYTAARYKVVWKRMAGDMVAAVISQHKTILGYKMVVPTDTTALFAADNEPEAHYLCAIINSTPVREFIASYSAAGRGFGAPSVMSHVGIPGFNPDNELHRTLAGLSLALHEITAKQGRKEALPGEKEVDRLVQMLFSEPAA